MFTTGNALALWFAFLPGLSFKPQVLAFALALALVHGVGQVGVIPNHVMFHLTLPLEADDFGQGSREQSAWCCHSCSIDVQLDWDSPHGQIYDPFEGLVLLSELQTRCGELPQPIPQQSSQLASFPPGCPEIVLVVGVGLVLVIDGVPSPVLFHVEVPPAIILPVILSEEGVLVSQGVGLMAICQLLVP